MFIVDEINAVWRIFCWSGSSKRLLIILFCFVLFSFCRVQNCSSSNMLLSDLTRFALPTNRMKFDATFCFWYCYYYYYYFLLIMSFFCVFYLCDSRGTRRRWRRWLGTPRYVSCVLCVHVRTCQFSYMKYRRDHSLLRWICWLDVLVASRSVVRVVHEIAGF